MIETKPAPVLPGIFFLHEAHSSSLLFCLCRVSAMSNTTLLGFQGFWFNLQRKII